MVISWKVWDRALLFSLSAAAPLTLSPEEEPGVVQVAGMQTGDVVLLSSSITKECISRGTQRVCDTGAGRKLPLLGLAALINPC